MLGHRLYYEAIPGKINSGRLPIRWHHHSCPTLYRNTCQSRTESKHVELIAHGTAAGKMVTDGGPNGGKKLAEPTGRYLPQRALGSVAGVGDDSVSSGSLF